MDFLNRLQSQFTTFWEQLEAKQRVVLVGTLIAVFVGMVSLLVWANRTEYAALYANVSPEVAPEILEQLDASGVPFKLERGGGTILVPAEDVLRVRLSLAGKGIPKNGTVGFEIFDNPSVSTTSFVEKFNYQRALQGELERTINQMEGIESSRVFLVIPPKRTFVEDQKAPSASVALKLSSGKGLGREQVRSITHLLASAVEGMEPGQVSIVDTSGKLLSQPSDDTMAGAPSSLLEHQEMMERKLEDRTTRFLERVTGPGKVMVKVQAALDMTSQEKTQERFDPDSKVARSTQRNTENRDSTIPGVEGTPGADANIPGQTAGVNVTAQRNTVEKIQETENFEVDKTTTRIVEMPGRLSRLSVAVLIDGSYIKGEEGTSSYSARSTEEMALFNDIIKSAVGFSEDRGDTVEVRNIQFHSLESEIPETTAPLQWQTPARYALTLLGMLMAFFLLRPLLTTLVAEGTAAKEEDESIAGTIEDGGVNGLAPGEEAGAAALGNSGTQHLLTAGNMDRQRREEMVHLAQSDMDNTISTLQEWLRDEDVSERKSA